MFKRHIAFVCRGLCSCFLQNRKMLCYAAQSLVEGRCPFWMGPDFAWASSQVGAVVACDRAPTPVFSITEAPVSVRQPIARSAKEKVGPDVLHDAARTKIQKLEKALEVMEDAVGPAVDALKAELDKARQAAKSNVQRNVCWTWSKSGKPKLRCWRTRRRGWPRRRSPIKNQKPPPVPLLRLSLRQRGPENGSFEGQTVFCRRRAGCGGPGHCMQASSHHSQHNVHRHSVDANARAEGSRRLDAGSQFGSPGYRSCQQGLLKCRR